MALLTDCCPGPLPDTSSSSAIQRAVFLHLPKNRSIDIDFENVKFKVKDAKGSKQILSGVSGHFQCGELTAIMGPSGAGKSSLLNIITGFQESGVSGKVGGVSIGRRGSRFRKDSCYIMQDDHLCPLFTVMEIMTMAADLKLGSSLSTKAKQWIIDDVLQVLGLSGTRENRCDRLSGGQKKRLSIALELIDNPPVLFLDEPTTGLDSLSSLQVVSTLKALARGGRTIVCTIHQPSATIFELFDHVYVLAKGFNVYQGSALNTVPYLAAIGLPCPKYHNPADFLMDVAAGELGDHCEALVQHATKKNWRGEKSMKNSPMDITDKNTQKAMVLVQRPSEMQRFGTLFYRAMLQLYRDWTVTHMKFALHIVVGVIFGLCFTDAGWDGSKTVSNFSFCMCICVYLSYTSMMPAVLRFPLELAVLRKEQFNNWYKLPTYYAAFIVANVPVQMVYCCAFTSLAYYMSGQIIDFSRFIMFLSICQLLTIMSESIGLFLGTTCSPVNGTFWGAIYTAVCLLFAGFVIFISHMHPWLSWMADINYMRYSLDGLTLSVYGYGRDKLECPNEEMYCHLRVPSTLLKEVGIQDGRYWVDVSAILGMIVLVRAVSFISLKKKVTGRLL